MVKLDFQQKKLKLWSKLSCLYDEKRFEKNCKYPESWINCNDLQYKDITLDEMKNRINGSDCMIERREKMYEWAKASGTLRELCGGAYDVFCDKDLLYSRMISKGDSVFIECNEKNADSAKVSTNNVEYKDNMMHVNLVFKTQYIALGIVLIVSFLVIVECTIHNIVKKYGKQGYNKVRAFDVSSSGSEAVN